MLRPLREFFNALFALASASLLFLILVVPISLFIWPLPRDRRTTLSAPFWRLYCRLVIKFSLGQKVILIDRRPSKFQKMLTPPGLYMANHQSAIDIPLIFSYLMIPPIMKQEILLIPFFGICAYSAGAITVKRRESKSRRVVFKMACDRLQSGFKALQYYPEGSRQKDGKGPAPYAKIKTALLSYAYKNNIEVYPMSIHGTDRVIPYSNTLRVQRNNRVSMLFHNAIRPSDFQDVEEFNQYCWQQVQRGYEELASLKD